jgi:hypothetical protein
MDGNQTRFAELRIPNRQHTGTKIYIPKLKISSFAYSQASDT